MSEMYNDQLIEEPLSGQRVRFSILLNFPQKNN